MRKKVGLFLIVGSLLIISGSLHAYPYNESSITVSSGWNNLVLLPDEAGDSSYLTLRAGTLIGLGQTLSFSLDAIIYNAALSDPSFWGEGDVWGQSWFATDTKRGGDGGSTAPVPEPASMLLFGTGLLFSGLISRKYKKRLS
jgi:hypothetical protein